MIHHGIPHNGDWRELAKRIQNESDPQKMIELVEQLLATFDEEKLRNSAPRPLTPASVPSHSRKP